MEAVLASFGGVARTAVQAWLSVNAVSRRLPAGFEEVALFGECLPEFGAPQRTHPQRVYPPNARTTACADAKIARDAA
ncbi:hypothetical protein [Micromonospora sp. NPDC005220]|uniref:hypothetical protein n=1 Tax=Micromonospora sp. NPDC005220 TaxID=3155589 RepID=UPI0033BEE7E1